MTKMVIESICKDQNARIPVEFRTNKIEAAKFLMLSADINPNEIKNPGWWAIKRWLNEDATNDDFDEVVSIELIGEEKTYDLTVPDGNSFSANGMTVHNCNLPNSATKELVSDVYMQAWESGCKGFTVYRDGCRTGVLVSTDTPKKEEKGDGRHAKKRPKELPCDIHRATVRSESGSENWMVLISLLDGKPYEVFCGIAGNIEAPKKYKSGMLIKNGKRDGMSTYNLKIQVDKDDDLIFKDVANLFDNPTQGAFTRTISLALRHEVPIQYVVEQLQKDRHSDMFSFAKTISRVLKSYIKDGTTVSGRSCQDCGSTDLIYQEGCMTCMSCGSSKCV